MGKFLDAAFRSFKKRRSEAEKEEFVNALADAITVRTFGNPITPEERAAIEEQDKLAKEGRRIRKSKMDAMGVRVGDFTEQKVKSDALALVDQFVPEARKMKLGFESGSASVDFQNLTKTGKLPKNVANGQYLCDSPFGAVIEESLIVNLKYLRDGSVNMADIYAWRSHVGLGVSIRKVNGEHRIAYITRTDSKTGVRDTLYSYELDAGNPKRLAGDALKKL